MAVIDTVELDARPPVGALVQPHGARPIERLVGEVVRRPDAVTYVIVAWESGWEQQVTFADRALDVIGAVCPTCDGGGDVQPGCDPQHTIPCSTCGGEGEITAEHYRQILEGETA